MIKKYTNTTIKDSKEPFAIYRNSEARWYTFPKAILEASLDDYKLWAEGSGRSMTGESKGTLIGIFPKLQVKLGVQTAQERAVLLQLLNQSEATVRAYCPERQRFEEASFYFGDVANKIKKWDKNGTLGARETLQGSYHKQGYTNKSMFEGASFSVISNRRRA